MAEVTKVDYRIKTTLNQSIMYQILTHCFFNDIQISGADLKCLAELAKLGEYELTLFCKVATSKNIFKSPQSARNAITKASKKGLIIKKGRNKKKVVISDKLNIQNTGVVLLEYKVLGQ